MEIVGAETGAAARSLLQSTTFDCVVMDLKLPDMSGADLLEQMASDDNVSFPPVIVYTGRSITREEEHRLRRYSQSIIIKGARSPDRLVDGPVCVRPTVLGLAQDALSLHPFTRHQSLDPDPDEPQALTVQSDGIQEPGRDPVDLQSDVGRVRQRA